VPTVERGRTAPASTLHGALEAPPTFTLIKSALYWAAATSAGTTRTVLSMSLRLTSAPLADEILDAWFWTTELDPTEVPNIEKVKNADF
jgi:hypothetical protein